MNELSYEYWWAAYYGLTDLKKRLVFEHFGSARGIYEASKTALQGVEGLSAAQIQGILDSRCEARILKDTQTMVEKDIYLTTLGMTDYPLRLRGVVDAPYGLFYRGDLSIANGKTIAMVGARRASNYGKTMSMHFARSLAEEGAVIVSGMARGIDGAAHRGALSAGGKTIAVLGGGVEYCYPRENRDIYEQIGTKGLLISQYCPGTQPIARFFPARNRIISGLSDVVMVMEAKEKSGSLITVDFALEQGRDIYAMPGRITDVMSTGCNNLIRQGAGILQNPETFWQEYRESGLGTYIEEMENMPKLTHYEPEKAGIISKTEDQKDKKSDNSPEFSLEKEDSMVYSCFDFYARSIQDVADETGLDLLKLISIVMRLCELGLIRESFKNQYIRCK
ncbi:MAG: DNA-processing protein DprA [Lachnospiraceae bacterium]|nr:DNA-processing protein DprA [Lachnospiraceae bacterium]